MAQYYHSTNQGTRSNLTAMKTGLGRSEPDISTYARFERRGSTILDIFNESPIAPASPAVSSKQYLKFQNGEIGEGHQGSIGRVKSTTRRERLKKLMSVERSSYDNEERNSFTTQVDDRNQFERGLFPNASSSATPSERSTQPLLDESQARKGSKLSVIMQNPWRQKHKRRRSGVQMTVDSAIDQLEEPGEPTDGCDQNGINDGTSLLLEIPMARKDYYSSHEQLFEQHSERKRRFWEFMKSREHVMRYDVFISYNHDSKAFAHSLYKTLKHTFKYSVFIDKQLSTKQKLNSALDEALRNTKLVVCVVTEKYSRSKSCCAEVSLANNLGLPMIPLVIEDLPLHKQNPKNFWPPEGEMSLPLAPLLYIDFRNFKNEAAAEEKMKELKMRIEAITELIV